VHRELQNLAMEVGSEAALRARKGHFRRWLTAHGVPPERLEQAAQRVVEALLAVHADPRGRWIFDGAHQEAYREHSLSAEHAGEILRVVFDRTFVDESGVRWVIDYKTSHHAGGGREEFLDREVERYRPQLERYALLARRMGPQPVKVGLYFPLMRGWREWVP
jgi:ATP-dependent exoDNAse (exonuclease V) beta subunit